MAKYRALVTSFANNRIVEPGDVVDLDGEVGSNFELAEKPAKGEKPKPTLPTEVDQLITAVKLHAATRGVPPTEVNELDFDEVLKVVTPQPSTETVKAAAAELGVTLGQSVA